MKLTVGTVAVPPAEGGATPVQSHHWWPNRERWRRTAQWCAVLLAVSIAVSTSATSIFAGATLIAALAAMPPAELRRAMALPAALAALGLPVITLAALAWTIAPFEVAADVIDKYCRLAVLGVFVWVLADVRTRERVLVSLGLVMAVLLVLSTASVLWPAGPWGWMTSPGIVTKTYIIQSMGFVLMAFALAHLAVDAWCEARRWRVAAALSLAALAFLANVLLVASARSSWIALAAVVVLFCVQRMGLIRGMSVGMLVVALSAPIALESSSYVRERVAVAASEIEQVRDAGEIEATLATQTSVGVRLALWNHGFGFVREAPLFGHGTGSILPLYARIARVEGVPVAVTDDPHNQLLAVAIPYGALGVVALFALWIALALALRGAGVVVWLGQAFLVQHVITSMFFSSIWIFDQGWMFITLAATFVAASATQEGRARGSGADR